MTCVVGCSLSPLSRLACEMDRRVSSGISGFEFDPV
jgi:hypothetical protein